MLKHQIKPDFFSWTKEAKKGTINPSVKNPKWIIANGIFLLWIFTGILEYTPSLKWTCDLIVEEKALLVENLTNCCLNIIAVLMLPTIECVQRC